MPVVPCPYCSNPVTLPDPWAGRGYTCPHCRRAVATAPHPSPPPPDERFELDPDPRPRRRPSSNPVGDFLTFRLMITPVLIQVVFWAGVAVCLGSGVVQIVGSFRAPADDPRDRWDARDDDRFGDARPAPRPPARPNVAPPTKFSPLLFAAGLATMTFGPLLVRLYCELLIIIFKIHDELKAANDRRRYRA